MADVQVAANFHDQPAVIELSVSTEGIAAIGVWVLCLSWMNRRRPTVTSIPRGAVRHFGGTPATIDLLIRVGLWSDLGDGQYRPELFDVYGDPIWRRAPDPSRPPIPRQVREAVFARDGDCCVLCVTPDDLTLDHIHPWSLGGPDTEDNLRVLCRPCNSRKGARV